MGGIRRSSRRATIERRIWAQPKKERLTIEDIRFPVRGRSRQIPNTNKAKNVSLTRKKFSLQKSYSKRQKRKVGNSLNDNQNVVHQATLIENGSLSMNDMCLDEGSFCKGVSSNKGVESLKTDMVDNIDVMDVSTTSQGKQLSIPFGLTYTTYPNGLPTTICNADQSNTKLYSNENENLTSTVSSPITKNLSSANILNLQDKKNCTEEPSNTSYTDTFPLANTCNSNPLHGIDLSGSNVLQTIGMRYPELEVVKINLNRNDNVEQKELETDNSCAKEEEDNHVSLSEALATLVNSDDSSQRLESETVTIHPAFVPEPEDLSLKNVLVNSNISASSNRLKDESIATALLSLKSGCREFLDNGSFTSPQMESVHGSQDLLQDELCYVQKVAKDEEGSASTIFSTESEESNSSVSQDHPPAKHLSQPPPLVRISNRPPAIKIPLQCSECPMRFCTVRSLLWHFGTHILKKEEIESTPMLLKDLLVSWNAPEIPVKKLSSAMDTENNNENPFSSMTNGSMINSNSIISSDDDLAHKHSGSDIISNNTASSYTSKDFILKVPIPKLSNRNPIYYTSGGSSPSNHDLTENRVKNNSYLSTNESNLQSASILPRILMGELPSNTSVSCSSVVNLSNDSRFENYNMNGDFNRSISENSLPQDLTMKPIIANESAAPSEFLHGSRNLTAEKVLKPIPPLNSLPPNNSTEDGPNLLTTGSSSICYNQVNDTRPYITQKPGKVCEMSTQTTLNYLDTNLPKQITVIPVDKLGDIKKELQNQLPFYNSTSSCNFSKKDCCKQLEKDGLVMINQNLALRIVSSNMDLQDVSISPILKNEFESSSGESSNDGLTILPQTKSSKTQSYFKCNESQPPDILTIVPQIDRTKQDLHQKNFPEEAPAQIITAAGKVTPDASQVVKLVLLPSKKLSKITPSYADDSSDVSPSKLLSLLKEDKTKEKLRHFNIEIDDSEESDEGMVIDVKDEAVESSMDPLSMCAVTMEDEAYESHYSLRRKPLHKEFSEKQESPPAETKFSEGEEVHLKLKRNQVEEEKYQRRKYVCKYCQKRFGWSTDLKRHIILHTGERPFKCKWCPITFTRKFLLQNHMKKLHPLLCKWSDLWE